MKPLGKFKAKPMIELIEDLPRHVVGITVRGRVTEDECREILVPAIAKALRWRDKVRLYYELGSRFPGSGWDDLDLGVEHATSCERIAIVTDIAWVRLTVKAIRFLIPGDIRVFDTSETDAARAWITAKSGARPDTVALEPARTVRARPRRGRAVPASPRPAAARIRRDHEDIGAGYAE